jgi:hypothetical protein
MDNMLAAIIATILEGDGHTACEEIVAESQMPKSSVHCVLTEVLKKGKVTAHSLIMLDVIAQSIKTPFSLIRSGKLPLNVSLCGQQFQSSECTHDATSDSINPVDNQMVYRQYQSFGKLS